MRTIKLDKPLTIMAGKPIPKELLESGVVKLPFEATGMECSKNQDIIDALGYGKKKEKKKEVRAQKKKTKRRYSKKDE